MNDYDDYTDEDDDYGILKKALDVELPNDFDPNKVPQTGEEYLQHVMYERTKCKTWLTVDIDRSKFQHKQTLKITLDKLDNTVPRSLLPTLKWQEDKLQQFTQFRKFIHYKITREPTVNSFDEDHFASRLLNETPVFNEMITYSQAAKIRMLQLIGKHLEVMDKGSSFSTVTGNWIYSLLSLIEKPLNPNFCHTVREFIKKLVNIRSGLSEDCGDDLITPLNLLICIAARFFHQLDLADT